MFVSVLRRVLVLMILGLVSVAAASFSTHYQAGEPTLINKLNFGVVVKRLSQVDVVTDSWNQAYIIRLPTLHVDESVQDSLNCSHLNSSNSQLMCARMKPMIEYLYNISRRATTRIHQLVRHIRAMVPNHRPIHNRRQKKGLIDLGGELLHGLFGTARDSDIEQVRHTLNEIRRQGLHSMEAFSTISGRLAGVAKATNARMNVLHAALEQQRSAIHTVYDEVALESREMREAALLLTSALSRLEDFVLVLDNLERLQIGIDLLSHGFLSPIVLPAAELAHTLYLIGNMVRRHVGFGFRILRTDPSYYYALHHYVAARQDDHLVVNLRIPLTHFAGTWTLYQVLTYPVPIPNDKHMTQLTDVPKFFAYNPMRQHHLRFDAMPHLETSNLLFLSDTDGIFYSNDRLACILAIMRDQKPQIDSSC